MEIVSKSGGSNQALEKKNKQTNKKFNQTNKS